MTKYMVGKSDRMLFNHVICAKSVEHVLTWINSELVEVSKNRRDPDELVYYDSWEEAHVFLFARAMTRVRLAREAVQKIKELQKPETEKQTTDIKTVYQRDEKQYG